MKYLMLNTTNGSCMVIKYGLMAGNLFDYVTRLTMRYELSKYDYSYNEFTDYLLYNLCMYFKEYGKDLGEEYVVSRGGKTVGLQ